MILKSKPMEISNQDYHNSDKYKEFFSSSQLKDYLISPKFANYKRENPQEFKIGTEAAMKGSVYHDLLASWALRKDYTLFDELWFVFEPPINPKTNASYGITSQKYTEALEFAMSNNPNKECTSTAEVDLCKKMIHELLNNCGQTSIDINKIINNGEPECSHFVEYEGCKFKFRPDIQTSEKIVDWKSSSVDKLKENEIAREIAKFNYDISASFYQFLDYQQTGKWRSFYWVFQQKSPPYDAVIVCADNWAFAPYIDTDGKQKAHLGFGASKMMNLINQHIHCTDTGYFQGAEVFITPDLFKHRIMYTVPPKYNNINYEFFND